MASGCGGSVGLLTNQLVGVDRMRENKMLRLILGGWMMSTDW